MLPASTTKTSVQVSTTAGSRSKLLGGQARGRRRSHRPRSAGSPGCGPRRARPAPTRAGDQRRPAGGRHGVAEELVVRSPAGPTSGRPTAAYAAPIQATATAASGSSWPRERTIAPTTSARATNPAAATATVDSCWISRANAPRAISSPAATRPYGVPSRATTASGRAPRRRPSPRRRRRRPRGAGPTTPAVTVIRRRPRRPGW